MYVASAECSPWVGPFVLSSPQGVSKDLVVAPVLRYAASRLLRTNGCGGAQCGSLSVRFAGSFPFGKPRTGPAIQPPACFSFVKLPSIRPFDKLRTYSGRTVSGITGVRTVSGITGVRTVSGITGVRTVSGITGVRFEQAKIIIHPGLFCVSPVFDKVALQRQKAQNGPFVFAVKALFLLLSPACGREEQSIPPISHCQVIAGVLLHFKRPPSPSNATHAATAQYSRLAAPGP